MTRRELLALYKKSALTEEKMKKLLADIEKQDSIPDYLFEEMDFDDAEEAGTGKKGEKGISEARFAALMKKSIRKACFKMFAGIAVTAIIAVLLTHTVLPKIIYYNPSASVKKMDNQFALDLSVYSELKVPAAYRSHAEVENQGWGNYSVLIPQTVTYPGEPGTDIAGTIRRGKLKLYNPNILRPLDNVFGWDGVVVNNKKDATLTQYMEQEKRKLIGSGEEDADPVHSWAGNREEATELLQKLSENKDYWCYVTLDSVTSYDKFLRWCDQNKIVHSWAAIQTDGTNYSRMGFYNDILLDSNEVWKSDEYPNLVAGEIKKTDKQRGSYTARMKESQKHFTSMLRYLNDHKKFTKMFMEDRDIDMFEDYISYVGKNGLNVYGFMVRIDKKEALRINNIAGVYEIAAVEVR